MLDNMVGMYGSVQIMNENCKEVKISYYIVLVLTLSVLIFQNKLPNIVFLLLGLLSWMLVFRINIKKYEIVFTIIRMLILSIPLSFTNIWGQSTVYSNISWFNMFIILLFIVTLINIFSSIKKLKIKDIFLKLNILSYLSIIMIFITLIPLLISFDIIDGIKQYLYFSVTFSLLILGNFIKNKLDKDKKEILLLDYILSTRIAAIGVMVQALYKNITGVDIGYYRFFGGYRHAFGFLFSDFSFLSLFLASGAIAVFFIKKDGSKFNKYWIGEMIFLLIASIITSARTGIVSFIVVFFIYSILRIRSLITSGSVKKVFLIIFLNIGVLVGSYYLLSKVRPNMKRLFSLSGRIELNMEAFGIFMQNPIFGIGLGRHNYSDLIGMIPHNIVFQSLVQGGLFFTIPLLLFLFTLVWILYKKDRKLLPVISLILIGSLFIPNVFHSRFLTVLLLLLSLRI